MNPINQNNDLYKDTCTTIISSSCVKWPVSLDVSIIELQKGDSITDVILKLTTSLEEIKATYDVTQLELDCLDDCELGCNLKCDDEIVLHKVLNCLIKSHCDLKEEIINLQKENAIPDVNTECVSLFTLVPDLNTEYTNTELINYILAVICDVYNRTKNDGIQSTLTSLGERVSQLEAQIDADVDQNGEIEVDAGCTGYFTGNIPLSTAFAFLQNRVSSIEKSILNNHPTFPTIDCNQVNYSPLECLPDMQDQLAQLGISVDVGNSTTLESKIVDLYTINCALVNKMLTEYEPLKDCCVLSCNNIERELFATFAGGNYIITLTFEGSSTIPDFIESCGSSLLLTFTDQNNISATININLFDLNGGFTISSNDIRLSNLDKTADIKVELSGCFRIINESNNTTVECFICESSFLPSTANPEECEVCEFTITGCDDISVEVTYILSGQTTADKITVSSDQFTLPSNATIVSIVNLNKNCNSTFGVSVSSGTCVIPENTISNIACYELRIPNSLNEKSLDNPPSSGPFDWQITEIAGCPILVGDPTYASPTVLADANINTSCNGVNYTVDSNIVAFVDFINNTLEACGSPFTLTTTLRLISSSGFTRNTTMIFEGPDGLDLDMVMTSSIQIQDKVCIKPFKKLEDCNCDNIEQG